ATAQGDDECLQNIAGRRGNEWVQTPLVNVVGHPYDDELWQSRNPPTSLIDVPLLACVAWQDDQAGPRVGSVYFDRLDPEKTWVVFSNGHHGICDDYDSSPFAERIVSFFDRYVKGQPNGFEDGPHVEIWHETTPPDGFSVAQPSWVTTHPRWP